MKNMIMEKFKCLCMHSLDLSDADGNPCGLAFTQGQTYESANPDIWPPPDSNVQLALINNMGEEHFLSWAYFHRYFLKIKDGQPKY